MFDIEQIHQFFNNVVAGLQLTILNDNYDTLDPNAFLCPLSVWTEPSFINNKAGDFD